LRDRWSIDVPGGQDLSAVGNSLDHEYRIERGRQPVATVSKVSFRIRDSYGVEWLLERTWRSCSRSPWSST
jgi:uncharacterized protein YxjI